MGERVEPLIVEIDNVTRERTGRESAASIVACPVEHIAKTDYPILGVVFGHGLGAPLAHLAACSVRYEVFIDDPEAVERPATWPFNGP